MVLKEEKPLLAITKMISATLEKVSVEKHSSVWVAVPLTIYKFYIRNIYTKICKNSGEQRLGHDFNFWWQTIAR